MRVTQEGSGNSQSSEGSIYYSIRVYITFIHTIAIGCIEHIPRPFLAMQRKLEKRHTFVYVDIFTLLADAVITSRSQLNISD